MRNRADVELAHAVVAVHLDRIVRRIVV